MKRVKIGEFRNRASELIRHAAGGETIVSPGRHRKADPRPQGLVPQPHVTYLLDTHAWLWSVLDQPRLSRRARAALSAVSAQKRVGLAAISLKEAAWHLARGQVVVDESFGPWPLWLRTAASSPHLDVLPLTVDIAIESEQVGDSFPPDPADCLIAATARVHDLTLLITSATSSRGGA